MPANTMIGEIFQYTFTPTQAEAGTHYLTVTAASYLPLSTTEFASDSSASFSLTINPFVNPIVLSPPAISLQEVT